MIIETKLIIDYITDEIEQCIESALSFNEYGLTDNNDNHLKYAYGLFSIMRWLVYSFDNNYIEHAEAVSQKIWNARCSLVIESIQKRRKDND